jgi:hypothetical protein
MKSGIGINPTKPDILENSLGGPTGLIDHSQLRLDAVWKCPVCGHSADMNNTIDVKAEMQLIERMEIVSKNLWEDGWYVQSNIVSNGTDRIKELEIEVANLTAKLAEKSHHKQG